MYMIETWLTAVIGELIEHNALCRANNCENRQGCSHQTAHKELQNFYEQFFEYIKI